MAILLFCVGALTCIAGAAMIGFGVPISEFSFGNTLINAGVIAAVGGLVICALGAVVLKLRQIVDRLSEQALAGPARSPEMPEMYEAAAAMPAPPSRIPFPSKPPARAPRPPEPRPAMPQGLPAEPAAGQSFAPTFAPTLRNPDEPPAMEEEAFWTAPPPPPASRFSFREPPVEPAPFEPPAAREEPMTAPAEPEPRHDFVLRAPPPPPPPERRPGSDFDAMWPPEIRPPKAPLAGRAAPEPEPPLVAEAAAPEPLDEPEVPAPAAQPPSVAVLKSGVVDGMAYTLFVDGSIEAEMPQGTLRFASINELRDYLESNS